MSRFAMPVSVSLLAIMVVGFVFLSFSSFAQEPPTSGKSPQTGQQKMTAAEVLLQRELQNTLRSRARLGAKHPSVAVLDNKIAELRKQLNDLALASPAKSAAAKPNPFDKRKSGTVRNTTDLELREMVQALIQRVDTLEKKVSTLESRR